MNRKFTFASALGAIASIGLWLALPGRAAAQAPPDAPPPDAPPPPPAVVATVEPVYYDGHAAYWYGSHWYWRDAHGWHWYSAEPTFLHEHRGHASPPRHYERRR